MKFQEIEWIDCSKYWLLRINNGRRAMDFWIFPRFCFCWHLTEIQIDARLGKSKILIMVIENGTKASNKASKGSKDRIKALEVSIYELRQNESDKNWQNVDKNIQVSLTLKKLWNSFPLLVNDLL